jgi:hypothetical protein
LLQWSLVNHEACSTTAEGYVTLASRASAGSKHLSFGAGGFDPNRVAADFTAARRDKDRHRCLTLLKQAQDEVASWSKPLHRSRLQAVRAHLQEQAQALGHDSLEQLVRPGGRIRKPCHADLQAIVCAELGSGEPLGLIATAIGYDRRTVGRWWTAHKKRHWGNVPD